MFILAILLWALLMFAIAAVLVSAIHGGRHAGGVALSIAAVLVGAACLVRAIAVVIQARNDTGPRPPRRKEPAAAS